MRKLEGEDLVIKTIIIPSKPGATRVGLEAVLLGLG